MTVVLALIAWLARAGSAVNFISETVLIGFKAGVALHLSRARSCRSSCGIKGGHGDFWDRMGVFFRHVGETNTTSLALGGAALAVLILGKKFREEQARGSSGGDWRDLGRFLV